MISAYKDEYVHVKFEETEFGLFMHVDILKWSHRIFLRTLLTFEAIKAEMRALGSTVIRAAIPMTDRKNEKFAELYGFQPTDNALQNADHTRFDRIWEFNLEEEDGS